MTSYFVCLSGAVQARRMSHTMFSKTLLMFLIVNLVSDSYGQGPTNFFRSDYIYIEPEESFYKIHTIPRSWPDAQRVCAQEGAIFWHPDNDNEAHAVMSLWDEIEPEINWMYVGLSDILSEGIYQTVDGKRITEVYSTWEENNAAALLLPPDNRDCVHIDKAGYMNSDYCTKSLIFTCKKSLKLLEWNHKCNMPNLDYRFSKDYGKCYKIHTTPLKWTEASAMCEREQTSLAMINSRLEAYFLVQLTESTPRPRFINDYQRGIYHLGFHNMFNKGWQTVKGTPLNVDNDVWFDNYQPKGQEQCGAMFYTGRLINIDCNMTSLFICENEPDKIISPAIRSQKFSAQPFVSAGIK